MLLTAGQSRVCNTSTSGTMQHWAWPGSRTLVCVQVHGHSFVRLDHMLSFCTLTYLYLQDCRVQVPLCSTEFATCRECPADVCSEAPAHVQLADQYLHSYKGLHMPDPGGQAHSFPSRFLYTVPDLAGSIMYCTLASMLLMALSTSFVDITVCTYNNISNHNYLFTDVCHTHVYMSAGKIPEFSSGINQNQVIFPHKRIVPVVVQCGTVFAGSYN